MAISASFHEPRKRHLRKNRKDLFNIVIARINEHNLQDVTNLFYLNVGYIPSHIYESVPINGVTVYRTKLGRDEYSIFRSTDFIIQSQEKADEVIEMLNREYETVK